MSALFKYLAASPLVLFQTAFISYLFLVTLFHLHSSFYLFHVLLLATFYSLSLWALFVTARSDPGYLKQEHIEQIKLGIDYVKGKRQQEISEEVSMETVTGGTEGDLEAEKRDRVQKEQMGEVVMDLNRALVRAIRRRQVEIEMG